MLNKEIGVFLVRKSESIKECFVLSIKVAKYLNSNEISHYLIEKTKHGFNIKGYTKVFQDIESLITHCSFMRDMLPIILNLEYFKKEITLSEQMFNNFYDYSSSQSSITWSTTSISKYSMSSLTSESDSTFTLSPSISSTDLF